MTTIDNNPDHASLEAARWLVALEDDPDDNALRARFEAWLAANPANQAAWIDTADVYALMAKMPAAHALHWATTAAAARANIIAPAPRSKRSLRCRLAFGAVGAAIAACLAFLVVPDIVFRLQADHLTRTAEVQTLRLEDGSSVHLGPESAIALAFAAGERRVRLLKGEAFFEVTPDVDRPFRVSARDMETVVLGTAFSVRLGADDAMVGVRHGRVRVDYPAAKPPVSETLAAGGWIRVAWSGRVKRGTIPPDEVAAWIDGQIVARDRPMAEMVDELRRYYAGLIVLSDSTLGQQRVTGVYNIADPVAALQAIAGAHGGAVRQISPWLLVVSSR